MKKIIFCASAILLALSVLAGCAPRETPDGSPQNTKSASQTQSNSSTEQDRKSTRLNSSHAR